MRFLYIMKRQQQVKRGMDWRLSSLSCEQQNLDNMNAERWVVDTERRWATTQRQQAHIHICGAVVCKNRCRGSRIKGVAVAKYESKGEIQTTAATRGRTSRNG
jgi:hypothetical protein